MAVDMEAMGIHMAAIMEAMGILMAVIMAAMAAMAATAIPTCILTVEAGYYNP